MNIPTESDHILPVLEELLSPHFGTELEINWAISHFLKKCVRLNFESKGEPPYSVISS